MRFILFTFVGPERLAEWEAMTAAEKSADIERHKAWFAEHGAAGRIVGGEELGGAEHAKTVRKRGISDGPFIESKELLGGFIVVEVDSVETALEMARTWPGIVHDTDRVEVWPAGSSEAEADAQAQAEAVRESPGGG